MSTKNSNASGRLEIYGNKKTFNFPEKVVSNVLRSPYFRSLYEYKTFNQVVDEIYNQVSYLEPWVAGKGVGTPSSAFCLLYKLFTLRLSMKQIRVLLRHKDSPYIRALGFLYLRFGVNPRELWSWFEPYLQDEEAIVLKYHSQPTSIGKFVRDLLSKPKFFDIVLPRIPVTVQREIENQLKKYPEEKESKGLKRKRDSEKESSQIVSQECQVIARSEPGDTKQQDEAKKSLESSLYLEDLKKRYGDTSGTLEMRYGTQADTDTNTTQLPTAVKNYLQTL